MKISFISLGCAKNLVNTEQMMALCRDAGHTLQEEPAGADVVVINTCGFIDSAKEEAIDTILSAAELKAAGQVRKILVTGCLTQRYQQEILTELPEVDGIMGTGSYGEIVPALAELMAGGRPCRFADIHGMIDEFDRVLTTPKHYAYLRIAEGCDNRCAYCVIPSLRGRYRSRRMEDVLAEAKRLADAGVKECIVIAQDITRYGIDLYGERRLAALLRELCRLDFRWIRLHYLYPDELTDELIDTIAAEDKVLPYLDIPIQHCNDKVLKAMNRRGGRKEIEDAIARLRAAIPGITLRTTLIAGFPGETEEQYAELCDFVKTVKFDRLGCFAYSAEENTVAAKMPNQIDEETKQRRADHIMELQAEVSAEREGEKVGHTYECICDGVDDETGMYLLRTKADCPEIDGNVLTPADTPLETGAFYKVTITDSDTYDLYGYAEERLED